MNSKVKKLLKRQDGQIFLIALVLLAIGGLMLPPLLSFMGTGIKVSELHEEEMLSLYAADAGIEDALHFLKYTDPDDIPLSIIERNISNVNGNTVNCTITTTSLGEDTRKYEITSTATDINSGSVTTIEVTVQVTELFYTFGLLSLDGDLEFGGGFKIGDPPPASPTNIHANGTIDGGSSKTDVWGDATATEEVININDNFTYIRETVDYIVTPVVDESYIEQIRQDALVNQPGAYTAPKGYSTLGPAYIDGDFTIPNDSTVNLTGHVWVTGNINLGSSKSKIISDANAGVDAEIEDMYALVSSEPFEYTASASSSSIGTSESYIFLISLYESLSDKDWAINLAGGNFFSILYAPDGKIDITGNAVVEGAAIGESIGIHGSFSVTYPLPAKISDPDTREIGILSYIIK